jgi:hypothetical protein
MAAFLEVRVCIGTNAAQNAPAQCPTQLYFPPHSLYCRSYSPLPTRFRTVNPAFLASVIESGFSFVGELTWEMIFRTGFLQSGQFVSGGRDAGRRRLNFPLQTLHSPSHSSYS